MQATSLRKKVLLCLALSLLASKAAADVTIARRGKAAAQVVVAGGASETEKQAADELAFFLHIVTGGEFRVVQEAVGDGGRLLVGEGAVRLADQGFKAGGLGKEEIIVRTSGPDLILAGGSPRATLYAVYTFLEDVVGCRWWTSTASAMPWKRTLRIKPVAIRYAPPLEYREPFWFVAFDPIWDARNKVNGAKAGGDDLRGGRHVYEGFVHTFYPLSDYMTLLERAVRASEDHLGCYSPPDAKFLSLDTILRSWAILKKAEDRVRGTLEYARRVRSVQLPMAYAVFVRWDDLQKESFERNLAWPWPRARNEWLAWFLQAARAEKVDMISEWQALDDWAGKGGRSR